MSEAADTPAPAKPRRRWLPRSPQGWIILVSVLAVLLVGTVGVGLRYGINTVPGLAFLEAQLNGLKIGRYGRLKISGVSGDIWRNVNIERLVIYDEKGDWLQARDINMKWSYLELFVRRFHADSIVAQDLKILRRPTLTPKGKSQAAPVTVIIDNLRVVKAETLPAFSVRQGVFNVEGRLNARRRGGTSGRIVARSLLHQGDFADVGFDLGAGVMRIDAKASEAQGGALAGALGLPADKPFSLDAKANGKIAAGSFNLLLISGETEPARASGRWSQTESQASGYLRLDASQLTAGLAQRLGQEVRFDLTGRKGTGSWQNLVAHLRTETLNLDFVGPVDLSKRSIGPGGAQVTVTTSKLERVAISSLTGGAKLEARVSGTLSDLTAAGRAQGFDLKAFGYGLAGADGTFIATRRKGELTIKSAMTGAGGRGQGYLAALLGPKPFAKIDLVRLADGRILVRSGEAIGPGLKVQAKGSRSLLGGLDFDGTAEFSNFDAAKFSGRGLIKGSWSASQGGAGKPWAFTVDARGEKLALGWSQLDALLGASPRLRGKANLINGSVEVAEAELDGARFDVDTSGTYGKGGTLAFKLDWSAEGPVRAGPLEINGKAKGDGAITGTIKAARADLKAEVESIDVPRLPLKNANLTLTFMQKPGGGDGQITLTAASPYGPARVNTDFGFAAGGLDLTNLDADAGGVRAKGAISLRYFRPSTADLAINVGPGALLAEGSVAGTVKIADSAAGPRARLDLAAKDAVLRDASGVFLEEATIQADGPLARLPLRIQAKGDAPNGAYRFDVSGILSEVGKSWDLVVEGGGQIARTDFRTAEPARFRFGGGTTEAHLLLTSGERSRIDLDALLGGGRADVKAQLTDMPLSILNEDLAGRVSATLSLNGQGSTLNGRLDGDIQNVRARGSGRTFTLDGKITGELRDQTLRIAATATSAQGLKAEANFVLPTETSAAPLRLAINRQRNVQGRFSAEGEVAPLWDLLAGGDRTLKGQVSMNGTVGGTLADPRLLGEARLSNGAFEDGPTGLKLREVTLAANFADYAIDITQASGRDGGGGRISGSGRLNLTRGARSDLILDLNRFTVIDNDTAEAQASGKVTMSRDTEGKVAIKGDLRIDRAQIAAEPLTPSGVTPLQVTEINKPAAKGGRRIIQAQADTKDKLAVNLDIGLKADRGVQVEGRGLNVELSLDARVGGTSSKLTLTGEARVVRGEYDFAGKRFAFDDRGVIYLSTDPSRIRLNLTATREDPTLTAVIQVQGTAAKPEITLTSSPVLPQDEVLSRVLFGSSAAQLSPLEAAQLASALASLAGGGGFDVIGNVRELAGLDRLTFAGGSGGVMTVAGGKYVTDDVYIEIIGGSREGPAVQVEWRVRRELSVVSRLAGQGDGRLSIRWRRDY